MPRKDMVTAMAYELFCCSVRGESHIQKNIPCEDFGIKLYCDNCKFFASADGHGDTNCIRSSIGSELACRVAGEELTSFAENIKSQNWDEILFNENIAKDLVNQLILCIVGKWHAAISKDLADNPLSEDEIAAAPELAREYLNGTKIERMYGTTLIAGLVTEKYLLLLQQGDGRCVVFDKNGKATQPIPWDNRCVGNVTTSLCDSDASRSFRYHIIDLRKSPVVAVIAGTDGVEDSFPSSMEKTHAYYRELLKYASENGVPDFEEYLPDELSLLSAQGSCDDVTVSGIIDTERVLPLLGMFEKQNELICMQDELNALDERIISIEEGGKYNYLKEEYDRAAAEYSAAKTAHAVLCLRKSTLGESLAVFDSQDSDPEMPTGDTDFISRIVLSKMQEFSELMKNGECSLTDVSEFFAQLSDKEKKLNETAEALLEAEKALHAAEEKIASVESEFLPYHEKFERLKHEKEELLLKISEFRKTIDCEDE